MVQNLSVRLVIQIQIKSDKREEFTTWQKKMSDLLATFPGFLSQTISPPNPPVQQDWIIIQTFKSIESSKAWLQSDERQQILSEILPALVGIDNVYLIEDSKQQKDTVSATIANAINPQDEAHFLEWQARIAPLQSKFPGFIGYTLERPRPGIHDNWITIITFDSENHLDAWLNSPDRKNMLAELKSFSSESSIQKVDSGFDFWFTKPTYERSAWKENMLVLLTLYPVVFLLSFVQGPIMARGVPFWLALFFSNMISTAILGWITVPWLMQLFGWWLKPLLNRARLYSVMGALLVCVLYALSLLGAWVLSRLTT